MRCALTWLLTALFVTVSLAVAGCASTPKDQPQALTGHSQQMQQRHESPWLKYKH